MHKYRIQQGVVRGRETTMDGESSSDVMHKVTTALLYLDLKQGKTRDEKNVRCTGCCRLAPTRVVRESAHPYETNP